MLANEILNSDVSTGNFATDVSTGGDAQATEDSMPPAGPIDPVQFGQILEAVRSLQHELNDVREDVKALRTMADKSKGAMWMGMGVASAGGGLLSWISSMFLFK